MPHGTVDTFGSLIFESGDETATVVTISGVLAEGVRGRLVFCSGRSNTSNSGALLGSGVVAVGRDGMVTVSVGSWHERLGQRAQRYRFAARKTQARASRVITLALSQLLTHERPVGRWKQFTRSHAGSHDERSVCCPSVSRGARGRASGRRAEL